MIDDRSQRDDPTYTEAERREIWTRAQSDAPDLVAALRHARDVFGDIELEDWMWTN